ncbi:MAG: hypothetical protein PF590_08755 [Candidatus Delongbacteria bacterium]|jgi:hypothetical protein|nr:hypothetical protein [Candidatus Delongbacteria bacterium]
MSKNFKIEFYGHRKLGAFRKRLYIVGGVIQLTVGLFGLFNAYPASGFFLLSFALLIGGTGNVVFALIDRRILKERNFLKITPEVLIFKNSRRKPQSINLDQLSDVIVEEQKAEFIQKDQTVSVYDFSGFPITVGSEIITVLKGLRGFGLLADADASAS